MTNSAREVGLQLKTKGVSGSASRLVDVLCVKDQSRDSKTFRESGSMIPSKRLTSSSMVEFLIPHPTPVTPQRLPFMRSAMLEAGWSGPWKRTVLHLLVPVTCILPV